MAMSVVWNYSDPYEYIDRVQRNEMPPLIITVAITGGGTGKEVNPNIPETPEEQAQAAYEVYQAGAPSVHIHARDETGAETSTDPAKRNAWDFTIPSPMVNAIVWGDEN